MVVDMLTDNGYSPAVTTGKTPISGWSRAKEKLEELMLARLASKKQPEDADDKIELKPWRIYDLRRTAATGMERLDIKQQVVEALLGHTAGSKAGITGIYQFHTCEDEKRAALEKCAQTGVPPGARYLPLAEARHRFSARDVQDVLDRSAAPPIHSPKQLRAPNKYPSQKAPSPATPITTASTTMHSWTTDHNRNAFLQRSSLIWSLILTIRL
jgi:hypothetical protein